MLDYGSTKYLPLIKYIHHRGVDQSRQSPHSPVPVGLDWREFRFLEAFDAKITIAEHHRVRKNQKVGQQSFSLLTLLGSSNRFPHELDDAEGLNTDGRYTGQQVDDFFLVIGKTVGVEFLADGRVFRFLFLVLVEYPF